MNPWPYADFLLAGFSRLIAASTIPKKVRSLILIGTRHAAPRKLLKVQNAIFSILPKYTFAQTGFQKPDFISLCKSMANLNFTDALKDIGCRTLALCGDKNRANMAACIEMQASIPNASFAAIPNAGHEVNIDNLVALSKEIAFFQKSTQQPNAHSPPIQ